jgi:lipoprotein-releasing system permease protein
MGALLTSVELSIAWRYLRGRQKSRLLSFISVIAIVGVVVGVSALIVVMGIMNGLQHDLQEKILIGSPDIRVQARGENLRLDDWQSVLGKARQQPGVAAAAPFVMTQALVNAGHDFTDGGFVVGLPPVSGPNEAVTDIRQYAVSGTFSVTSSDGTSHGIVLATHLASRLGVRPGDTVNVLGRGAGKVNAVTGDFVPTVARLEVTGIFASGMYQYDDAFMYVAIPVAQELAGLGAAMTGIEIRTRQRADAPKVADALRAVLGKSYHLVDWREQNKALFQALNLEKLGMGLILLLIVLVAAFNIVSNLTMVVADKTREIGILKAMGMTSRSVGRVFLAQGLAIGCAGTAVGLVLGVSVSLALGRYQLIKLDPEVYMIDHVPVAAAPGDVAAAVIASVLIAVAATLYPSRQAAKLYPLEAIRRD